MNRVKKIVHYEYAIKMKYTGKDVGIAIFDTGVYEHVDLKNQIIGMKDLVNHRNHIYDDNGHGTHVAGIIAGSGKKSGGLYAGIAPKASIYAYKILDENGNGSLERAIEGVYDCINHRDSLGIRILNFSMGMGKNVEPHNKTKLLNALEKAWDYGIVVVCAAGNEGPKESSITPPGNLRKIITVGAMDDEEITTSGNLKGGYSSRGPTNSCILKPEVVAPGTEVMSCNHMNYPDYTVKSGTSMSTPVVSGAVALLIEKYPHIQPKDVKLRLYETCDDLGESRSHQGWGCLNIRRFLTGI